MRLIPICIPELWVTKLSHVNYIRPYMHQLLLLFCGPYLGILCYIVLMYDILECTH